MLIDVKPGMVFTSLTKISAVRLARKSTRAIPRNASALNAATAIARNFFALAAGMSAGNLVAEPSGSTYFDS